MEGREDGREEGGRDGGREGGRERESVRGWRGKSRKIGRKGKREGDSKEGKKGEIEVGEDWEMWLKGGWKRGRMGWREDGRRLKEGGIKWSDRGKVK